MPAKQRHIAAFCPLCVSRCGCEAVVEDGRLVGIEPGPSHPTGKTLCAKGRASPELAQTLSGPASVSKDATIMEMTADNKMNQLKAGTNGWMCMLEADGTPMCLDKEWQGWADAWINKKDPQVKSVGVASSICGTRSPSVSAAAAPPACAPYIARASRRW